jgi:hypothetical protein
VVEDENLQKNLVHEILNMIQAIIKKKPIALHEMNEVKKYIEQINISEILLTQ